MSAKVIDNVDQPTLQGFVARQTSSLGAKVYTDDHGGYVGLPNHETVRHSVKEYVNGMAHTNGIESFWSMLKRGHKGVYHKMSAKHLHRYINEFAGRHNQREDDTIDQMAAVARGLGGKAASVQGVGIVTFEKRMQFLFGRHPNSIASMYQVRSDGRSRSF